MHLPRDRRRQALPRLEEPGQHREPPVAPPAPRASSSRSSVVDDRHDHGDVGARVVLAAVAVAAAQPARLDGLGRRRRTAGSGCGSRASWPAPARSRTAWRRGRPRSAPTWRRRRATARRASPSSGGAGARPRGMPCRHRPARGTGPAASGVGRRGARRSRAGSAAGRSSSPDRHHRSLVAAHLEDPRRGVGEQPVEQVRLRAALGVPVQTGSGEREIRESFGQEAHASTLGAPATAYGDACGPQPPLPRRARQRRRAGSRPGQRRGAPRPPTTPTSQATTSRSSRTPSTGAGWSGCRAARPRPRRWSPPSGCSRCSRGGCPFSVPTPKGFAALKEGGRAAIYPYLPGQNVDFAAAAGRTRAGRRARARRSPRCTTPTTACSTRPGCRPTTPTPTAPAGSASSTAPPPPATCRPGCSPAGRSCSRTSTLWRFAPTPTHGDLTGDQVLVVFDDDQDAATGRVKAFTGWEDAKVADPADDFFALVTADLPARPRDADGGLRARPRRAARHPPAHPGPAVRRDAHALAS